MNSPKELEQSFYDADLYQELKNSNPADLDLDGSLIKNEGEDSQESQLHETEKKFDRKLRNATRRIRDIVKDISKEKEGTTLLKEVLQQIAGERKNKETREEKKSMQDKENTTGTIEKSSSPKLPTGETANNLPVVLDEQSLSLEKVSSDSMNLLDSSAKRLHESLKNMLPEINEDTLRKPDNHTIQVACHVAHEITNLMRLKLDVMKFAKTFEPKGEIQ